MHPLSDSGGAAVPAFLAKLWRLVEDPETDHLIYWNSDGRSFIIQNQAQFARDLLPLNYKHNNMASFIRQLNMYGFHKITSLDNGGLKFDRDDMEFTHPCFQRGHPFMLENIKRKIAHARNQPEEKTVATSSQAVVKPETLNRVLTEVKVMKGKQEVLDNRFSAMKQENEALWREVVMLRQKHMKQQQIVNKLIQFLVTIVQPSGRGNMGMKRRLPLMLNEAPIPNKSRKTGNIDYGLEISSLVDSDEDDDDDTDYMSLMNSSRGMISEIPNTPGSTKSHHDDLEDIDEIIEEEAPEEDVNKIFNELNEATSTGGGGGGEQSPQKTTLLKGKKMPANGNNKTTMKSLVAPRVSNDDAADLHQFLKFGDEGNSTEAGPSSGSSASAQVVSPVAVQQQQQGPVKTWYANKDGFISDEIPTELFDDQSQTGSIVGLQDSNVNPTLSEDITKRIIKIEEGEQSNNQKNNATKKFNGKHLQLARLPSNSGDVFSLATPEDFTMHLDSVQTDINALKGILSSDGLAYDPSQLAGPGTGSSPGATMGTINSNMLMSLVDNDYMPKMFDEGNVMIPYQLTSDCLNSLSNEAGGSTSGTQEEGTDKQLLQYDPTLDFSELLDDDSSNMVPVSSFLNTSVDQNGSLNTPQPQ